MDQSGRERAKQTEMVDIAMRQHYMQLMFLVTRDGELEQFLHRTSELQKCLQRLHYLDDAGDVTGAGAGDAAAAASESITLQRAQPGGTAPWHYGEGLFHARYSVRCAVWRQT